MTSDATRAAHRQLETLFRSGSTASLSDGQLLGRFADRSRGRSDDLGQAAFAAIVDRHGSMVLRACRRVLGDDHEAQEAAQATFLVLARRAGSLGRLESLGGWLHGVATRVASKARVATIRRRARELRGGELLAARMLDRQAAEAADDPDRWSELHEELGRLPEKFRAPLVLCYLEGLTQEQAAEALRWPLGTVQSRLARGRARLKARLTSRGVAPMAPWFGVGPTAALPPVPTPWAEATVRLAIQFTTRGSEAVRAGAWPASAGLASEALRAMMIPKLKFGVAALLAAAIVAAGVASMARLGPGGPPIPQVVAKAGPTPAPAPPQVPAPPGLTVVSMDRTLTGLVLDDRGHPVAGAWVGYAPQRREDNWKSLAPGEVRALREPFRDPDGEIVPPGPLGKYFEARDAQGAWHPVSPDDIYARDRSIFEDDPEAGAEFDKTHGPYAVRAEKGGWFMGNCMNLVDTPTRADDRGRFAIPIRLDFQGEARLHFASGDFRLQEGRTVKAVDFDRPIEIKLRPTRLVRARIIAPPRVDMEDFSPHIKIFPLSTEGLPSMDTWTYTIVGIPNEPSHLRRYLEIRLPFGRWSAMFWSPPGGGFGIEVPPGEGPLDLPAVRMEAPPAFPVPDDALTVGGRLVGPDGRGVPGASLTPANQFTYRGPWPKRADDDGRFAFHPQNTTDDHFSILARAPGFAPKIFRFDQDGKAREPLKLDVGVVVTGRVVRDGKPVVGDRIMLLQGQQPWLERIHGYLTIKTDDQGRFRFDHAYADEDLIVHAVLAGREALGLFDPRRFRTGREGSTVDLGEIEVKPGRSLSGRVVFADGKAIPAGTKVYAGDQPRRGPTSGEDVCWLGSIYSKVNPADGRFEFLGLPETAISLSLLFDDTLMRPPGYRLSPTMKGLIPDMPDYLAGQLDRDVDGLTILLEPGAEPKPDNDPGRLAEFEKVKARTITGAPQGAVPPK